MRSKTHSTRWRSIPGETYAVRSSATAEDLPDVSFAGQQGRFLNVLGDAIVDRMGIAFGRYHTFHSAENKQFCRNIEHGTSGTTESMASMTSPGLEFMRTRWGVIHRKEQGVDLQYEKSIDDDKLEIQINCG